MISAASTQSTQGFRSEWFEVRGPYGFVKTEYMDLVHEVLKQQQKEAAESLADRLKDSGTKAELTKEQKKYLSENFDPENMSRLEYQAFVDKLCEFGVLDEADKDYVGYGVKGCGLDLTPLSHVRTGASMVPAWGNPMGYTQFFSSSRGNVAGWSKYMASIMSWSEKTGSWEKGPEAILFGKIRDVLDAIA